MANSTPSTSLPSSQRTRMPSPFTSHMAGLVRPIPRAAWISAHASPGSFIEFLPILLKLKEKYASAPEKLPYHVIVPSIIGFGFSSPPPLNKGFTIRDNCRVFHKAMVALGFGDRGYITQGGDLGGPIAETLAAVYEPVKGQYYSARRLAIRNGC